MRTRQIAASLILPLALAISNQALAAEPTSNPIRSAQYNQGHDAIVAKDWTKAYEIFLDLWTHSKGSDTESDVLINLGQAELLIGKYRDAAEHLSIGILLIAPQDADVKERARKGLERAKKKIGTVTIVAPGGTELAINGKAIGTAPIATEVFVDPGPIKVTGKHPTQGAAESMFDVKAAEERKVELKLQAEPSSTTGVALTPPYSSSALDQRTTQTPTPAPIQISPPPPVEKKTGIETRTIVLIAGGAVTLIAAGTATYFGLKAHSSSKDAETLLAQAQKDFGQTPCLYPSGKAMCSEIRDKLDSHDSASRVFNVALPVSIGAAAATGLLYLVWPRSNTTSTVAVAPIANSQSHGLLLYGFF